MGAAILHGCLGFSDRSVAMMTKFEIRKKVLSLVTKMEQWVNVLLYQPRMARWMEMNEDALLPLIIHPNLWESRLVLSFFHTMIAPTLPGFTVLSHWEGAK